MLRNATRTTTFNHAAHHQYIQSIGGSSMFSSIPLMNNDHDTALLFQEDRQLASIDEGYWRVLVVDDNVAVHEATEYTLKGFHFGGKNICFHNACSARAAQDVLLAHPDIAVVLLDIVMETHDAGWRLVEFIRNELDNHTTRIVIRTGHPGHAPEHEIIQKYDINEYKEKTYISDKHLFAIITAALRGYADLLRLEEFNRVLEQQVQERTRQLQKQTDELARLNAELKMMNDEKNELMGIVAHDLKNPIGGIRGLAELIEMEALAPELHTELAQSIIVTADRMLSLVNQLLDVNAIETGKMSLNIVDVDTSVIVQNVVHDYQKQAEHKHITLCTDIQPHTLTRIDEGAAFQIYSNLISNAVKYSSLQGLVRIVNTVGAPDALSATLAEYGIATSLRITDEPSVLFFVTNEGHGISAAEQERLFTKFTKLSARPTAGEHSTGLGLSIVKKLVDMLHGQIWCVSEVGQGATFLVQFPAVEHGVSENCNGYKIL